MGNGSGAAVSLFTALVLLVSLSAVSAGLVAYYPFDANNVGIPGSCFTTVPTAILGGVAKRTLSAGKFEDGLNIYNHNDYAVLDGLNLFPSAKSSAFSVAAWIWLNRTTTSFNYRTIANKDGLITFRLVTSASSGEASTNFALQCRLQFGASVVTEARSPPNIFTKTRTGWTHVACIYNTSHVCVAYNGSLSTCSPADGQQVSPVAGRVFIGASTNSLRGVIDEVKFYDHGLTSEQLLLLYNGQRANDIPLSVTIESESIANGTLQADALTSVSFNGSATDGRLAYSGATGTRLDYSWSILSSQCNMATIANGASATPVLSLRDLGSFVLQLCASDGELSSGAQLQVLVTASEPEIIAQPEGGTLNVPRGSVVSLEVEGNGVPPPTYQWHYLTYENRTVENTTNPGENTTVLERNYYDDGEFPGEIEEDDEPHWLNNRDTWEIVEAWYPIEGANSSSYQVNGSQAGINNQTVSCLVSSTGGVAWSARYTVNLVAATPSASPGASPPSGGSSTDIAAIVGGAVGGAAGLFCLLLIVVAVLALVVAKRKGHRQRKLRQPDYVALAYGDLDGVSFPKKKAEHLARLEQLLLAEKGRLAHAMLAATSVNDAEKLCKAVMVVFEAHHLGFELLEGRITQEVAAAADEGTLFRANSLAAKLFAAYVRLVALPYLFFTLVTSVNSLNDNAIESFGEETGAASKRMRYKVDKLDDEDDSDSGTSLDVFSMTSSMEIDPHKMGGDASDSAINTLELWLAAQKLFKCIVNSERLMPTQIKHILMHIDAEVGERFSAQEQFRALGGFLFLRMVCPALMAPQVFGLLDTPPHPVAQRQFILVSKVLQNLANDTLPGAKEAYMEQLNSFIITNKAGLEQFYQKLVSGAQRGKAAMTQVPVKAKQRSLAVVHQWLEANLAGLEQILLNDEDGDSHQDHQLVEQLKEVLASLGDDASV